MTPMEKLKPQFDELKSLLGDTYKEINLNKSSYKEEYVGFCGETTQYINKGVKSDFIRLYRAQFNKEDTYTLGFSFNYINVESDKQVVTFSSSIGKEEKRFSSKKEMFIEEARDSLKNIINQLKQLEQPTANDKFKAVQEEFLGKDYQIKTQIKKKKIR